MVRLMVVADIRLYREGLARLLSSFEGFEVVATAGTRDRALERLASRDPGVVLVDRSVPDCLTLVSGLRSARPDIKVVVLTLEEDEGAVLPCAEAGIDGYVTRDASAEELVAAIRAAQAGELHCSPKTAGSLLRRVSHLAAARHPLSVLTKREVEVLGFLERGMSNRKISESLGIQVATVKNHVHNILEKLRVGGRGEAAAMFRRERLPEGAELKDLDREIHGSRPRPRATDH